MTASLNKDIKILPDQLTDYSFAHQIWEGRYGSVIRKIVHDDLRNVDFISTHPCVAHIIYGTETFYSESGEDLVLKDRDLIFVPRGQLMRSDFKMEDGPLRAVLVFFSDRLIDEFLDEAGTRIETQPIANPLKVDANEHLTQFIKSTHAIYHDLQVDEQLMRNKLLELLLLLSTLIGKEQIKELLFSGRSAQSSGNFKRTIERYALEQIPLETLALLTGRSMSSFKRDFQRIFQSSPAKWFREQRLNKARDLLETGSLSVTEIALEIHYDSTSHFIEQFKARFGCTPLRYRRDKSAEEAHSES